MGGGDQGSIAGRGQFWQNANKPATPTRADNIAASRADGTFDAKVKAFNAANKGSFMDAAGNIGPKAGAPTAPTSTTQTGASNASPQMPGGSKTTSMGGSYGTGSVKNDMGPRKPATFDGQSRESFFGAAAKKQGNGNAYANADGSSTSPPMASKLTQTKQETATPAPASPMAKAAAAPMPTSTPKPTTETPAGVPKPTFTDAGAQDRYNNSMASISDAPSPAKPASSTAPTVAAKPQPIISPAGSQASQSSMPTKTGSGMASTTPQSPAVNRAPARVADSAKVEPGFRGSKEGGAFKFAGDVLGKLGSGAKQLAVNAATAVNATGNAIAKRSAANNPSGYFGRKAKEKAKAAPTLVENKFKVKAIAGIAGARG